MICYSVFMNETKIMEPKVEHNGFTGNHAAKGNSNEPEENRSKIIDHKSKGEYTNNHLLHIVTGIATEEQVKISLKSAIIEGLRICERLKLNVTDGRFKVNVVSDRNGETFGYAYAWIVSPELFYLLIGRNPDGSERFEMVDDPDWTPPDINSSNWADITELEDQPKIRRSLPPLVKFHSYQFTEEQKRLMTRKGTSFGTHGQFECGPARVSEPGPEFMPNVLCGKNIPMELTAEDLKGLFRPFVSDPTKKHIKRSKGIGSEENFPLVTITTKRLAFVTFDSSSHDACFALKMARKITLVKLNKTYTLIFNRTYLKGKESSPSGTGPVEYFDS